MYLRLARAGALAFNILGTLAPLAAGTMLWSDNRFLAWVSISVFAVIVLFGMNIPVLGIAGMVVGSGLLAYALTEDQSSGLLGSIGAGVVYYLIAWQVHRAKAIAGQPEP